MTLSDPYSCLVLHETKGILNCSCLILTPEPSARVTGGPTLFLRQSIQISALGPSMSKTTLNFPCELSYTPQQWVNISWVSNVYLRLISGLSHGYFSRILLVSRAYFRHISGLSQAFLKHISGVSQSYKSSIPLVHHRHMSGKSKSSVTTKYHSYLLFITFIAEIFAAYAGSCLLVNMMFICTIIPV